MGGPATRVLLIPKGNNNNSHDVHITYKWDCNVIIDHASKFSNTNHNRYIIFKLYLQNIFQRPRESSTTVIILDYGNLMGEPATRVLLIPNTGRRHQLRVHCAVGLGHPIAGDITYSRRPFNHIDVEYKHDVYRTHNIHLDYKLKRMMLHAYYMEMKLRMNDDSNDNKCRKRLSVEKNYQFQTGENPFFDANDSYLWIEEENLLSQTTSYSLDEYIKNVNFFTS
uniref:PseudoU_synth_2 domain-containing protein n=1 Tax=Trichobilharzia regenti TaxID=157069 RepID=A0AA85KDM8_TRIRE|nr:unnamed protein product [Trichobilharzia regenti]